MIGRIPRLDVFQHGQALRINHEQFGFTVRIGT
jgi:hypothetical protein